VTCNGRMAEGLKVTPDRVLQSMLSERSRQMLPTLSDEPEQLSLFQHEVTREDVMKCLTGQM
jgi:hypothetical protein